MKMLLGLLVITNMALFYWITQHPTTPDDLASRAISDMPPLRLLSEISTDEALATASASTDDEKTAPRAVFLELSCYSLGPFAQQRGVNSAVAILTELGLVTRKKQETRRESTGFWVYIPPLPSREDARKVTAMLENRGVKDHLIIANGLNKNAISLGFFRTREGARQHQTHMQALGLAPVLEESFRESTGYWLDFSSPNSPPLPTAIIDTIQTQYEGVSMKKRQCS